MRSTTRTTTDPSPGRYTVAMTTPPTEDAPRRRPLDGVVPRLAGRLVPILEGVA